MVWNYHDDDIAGPDAPVALLITGLPAAAERVLLRYYRIDSDHSNAFSAWKKLGSPQNPSPEQYAQLDAAGQLELFKSPEWASNQNGKIELDLRLPSQSLSLVELSW